MRAWACVIGSYGYGLCRYGTHAQGEDGVHRISNIEPLKQSVERYERDGNDRQLRQDLIDFLARVTESLRSRRDAPTPR